MSSLVIPLACILPTQIAQQEADGIGGRDEAGAGKNAPAQLASVRRTQNGAFVRESYEVPMKKMRQYLPKTNAPSRRCVQKKKKSLALQPALVIVDHYHHNVW